jgi:hypothetical protein
MAAPDSAEKSSRTSVCKSLSNEFRVQQHADAAHRRIGRDDGPATMQGLRLGGASDLQARASMRADEKTEQEKDFFRDACSVHVSVVINYGY